ncbi:MAG: LLM class flavin-dependent oxidoreductase, partial [Rhodospirillaceae bacterium]|nr:LLM class flavin-dependent oxidoreductase [Rhodospirillaceae bacterium]
ERGFAKAGKTRADFEIAYPVFSVMGRDEKEIAAETTKMRQQVAFYGSTPAYKPVLDSIDAGELQPELNAMSKQGRWVEMGDLIGDDVLKKFAVQGDAATIAQQIKPRYGHIADRTAASYATLDRAERIAFIEAMRA